MTQHHMLRQHTFYAIGLNHKKTAAEIRGRFSLDHQQKIKLLEKAKKQKMKGVVAIITCNRTEIYGFAEHPFQLIKLLCEQTKGTVEEFEKTAYIYKNNSAISHLFKVATGLDSQILGDFEIIAQLKQSFAASKKIGIVNPFLERLFNAATQASKRIKNETKLSSGATSVAFASVQYILKNVKDASSKNILLFGTGKIGRNTCENLIKHTKNNQITLINRTQDKAEKIAKKLHVMVKNHASLKTEIEKSDILIVATGAQKPTVTKEHINFDKNLVILDLSVPKNVDESVTDFKNVTLVHLDQLTEITHETLAERKRFIPKAEAIIEEVKTEFINWLATRKFAPTLNALKNKLTTIKDAELDFQRKKLSNFDENHAEIITSRIIQKITTQFASHLKQSNGNANESIELIQKVFQLESKELS